MNLEHFSRSNREKVRSSGTFIHTQTVGNKNFVHSHA